MMGWTDLAQAKNTSRKAWRTVGVVEQNERKEGNLKSCMHCISLKELVLCCYNLFKRQIIMTKPPLEPMNMTA